MAGASSVLATRLLGGFGFALYSVNANPYLVAATAPEDRNYVFSIQVALSALAGFIGSLIAGLMPDAFAAILDLGLDGSGPYRDPLFIAGLIMCPAIWALLTTSEVTSAAEVKLTKTARSQSDVRAGLLFVIGLLAVTALCRNGGVPRAFLGGAALATAGALMFAGYFRIPRGEYARGIR